MTRNKSKTKQKFNSLINLCKKNKKQWCTLYTQGWTQYSHEDNLGQTRSKFFLGIQTAFLITLSAILRPMIFPNKGEFFFENRNLGLLIFGFMVLIISIINIIINFNWLSVTRAGRKYVQLRRLQLSALEKLAGLTEIGLASQEKEWLDMKKESSSSSNCEKFKLYPGQEEFNEYSLEPIKANSGWLVMETGIVCLLCLWFIISIIATCIIMF